ncbi:hypothetical protein SK128_012223 [Halocaridina rubra]|uniref:Uncharacterized protein n=1 Tax=Halocaridina rubra TaxID=373956 RepID=A0AAN8X8R4_HALRR
MAKTRLVIIVICAVFALYWGGAIRATSRMLFTFISSISPFHIQYVRDPEHRNSHVESDPEAVLIDNIAEAMETNHMKMSDHMLDVVNLMEELIDDNDLDSMNSEELEDTFAQIYDMLPLMDTVFAKALEYEAGVSINPRTDYHETHRRYEALRNTLQKKRQEKRLAKEPYQEKTKINTNKKVDDDEEGHVQDEL